MGLKCVHGKSKKPRLSFRSWSEIPKRLGRRKSPGTVAPSRWCCQKQITSGSVAQISHWSNSCDVHRYMVQMTSSSNAIPASQERSTFELPPRHECDVRIASSRAKRSSAEMVLPTPRCHLVPKCSHDGGDTKGRREQIIGSRKVTIDGLAGNGITHLFCRPDLAGGCCCGRPMGACPGRGGTTSCSGRQFARGHRTRTRIDHGDS